MSARTRRNKQLASLYPLAELTIYSTCEYWYMYHSNLMFVGAVSNYNGKRHCI